MNGCKQIAIYKKKGVICHLSNKLPKDSPFVPLQDQSSIRGSASKAASKSRSLGGARPSCFSSKKRMSIAIFRYYCQYQYMYIYIYIYTYICSIFGIVGYIYTYIITVNMCVYIHMYSGRLLLEYDGICMMEYGGQWDSMGDI